MAKEDEMLAALQRLVAIAEENAAMNRNALAAQEKLRRLCVRLMWLVLALGAFVGAATFLAPPQPR